jgi:DNA helicase-2/ATP-dependent DNA helicase PcrA
LSETKDYATLSERVLDDLLRSPMNEAYDKAIHSTEKGRWLADKFFTMNTLEIPTYIDFIEDNTPFSTQHGVKGEEYTNVVVLFDDVEAAWNNYRFLKIIFFTLNPSAAKSELTKSGVFLEDQVTISINSLKEE